MGLLSIKKPELNVQSLNFWEPQPEPRNGDGVKGGVHESLLAAIQKIVHDEIRSALREVQTETWVQKIKRRFL